MELRQLKTFKTVAQLLSFNRAAETLHYAQSTISAQIKALEEEFEKPLFDRLGKRIVLTETGETLLRYAQKMLDIEEETITQVSGMEESHGSITIRMSQSLGIYFLPSVIQKFMKKFPKVRLDIRNCSISVQHELRSGIVDLAFLITDSIHGADLKADVLGYETLFLVCHPNHPHLKKNQISVLSWPEEKFESAILMIRHKDKWISPSLHAFMEFFREELKKYYS